MLNSISDLHTLGKHHSALVRTNHPQLSNVLHSTKLNIALCSGIIAIVILAKRVSVFHKRIKSYVGNNIPRAIKLSLLGL